MRRQCWDCYWLKRAELNASMSTCLKRQVGAVLVREKRTVADGFNGTLSEMEHCYNGGCRRCNEDIKSGEDLYRCVCVHAEANIISYCAKWGISTDRTTLYTLTSPCLDCTKLVLSSGIIEIVYRDQYSEALEEIETLSQFKAWTHRFECRCINASEQVKLHSSV